MTVTGSEFDSAEVALRKRRRRRRMQAFLILAAVIVVPTSVIGVNFALAVHDRNNTVSIECTITDAWFGSDSVRSPGGFGASRLEVSIDTEECGLLSLRQGVTRDNGEAIVSRFSAGETYAFQAGEIAWGRRDWPILASDETRIYDYHRVDD